jgi:ribA/ribD-fused uncharacterized protein
MIESFTDGYRWLSNFAPVKIVLDGIEYPSVEHAYVSAKSTEPSWRKACSDPSLTAGAIKKMGRGITLRSDWEEVKDGVMKTCIEQKFSQEPYTWLLRQTKDTPIQEGNSWGDVYWGVDKEKGGLNKLGILIMEVREHIRQFGPYPLPSSKIEHLTLEA